MHVAESLAFVYERLKKERQRRCAGRITDCSPYRTRGKWHTTSLRLGSRRRRFWRVRERHEARGVNVARREKRRGGRRSGDHRERGNGGGEAVAALTSRCRRRATRFVLRTRRAWRGRVAPVRHRHTGHRVVGMRRRRGLRGRRCHHLRRARARGNGQHQMERAGREQCANDA